MKAVILYRPKSEHASTVESFLRDYQMRHNSHKLEVINVDDRDGRAMCSLYDITRYPAVLVMTIDGTSLATWQGDQLPLIDEVASYMFQR